MIRYNSHDKGFGEITFNSVLVKLVQARYIRCAAANGSRDKRECFNAENKSDKSWIIASCRNPYQEAFVVVVVKDGVVPRVVVWRLLSSVIVSMDTS